MRTIKRYDEDGSCETIAVVSIGQYYIDNIEYFKEGWRLYSGSVAQNCDITHDAKSICEAQSVIMLRTANGPLTPFIPYIIAAVVAVGVSLALSPSIPGAPSTASRNQSSSTNSLANRENEARNGQRMDDCWGKVSGFVPSLIQVPHTRYINNTEVEYFATAQCGEGLIANVFDGDTPFTSLSNAKMNAWNNGGNPNNGATPHLVIGGEINKPLRLVQNATELASSELLPPNDLSIGGTRSWVVTSQADSATFKLSNAAELDLDLRENFTASSRILVLDAVALVSTTSKTLYRKTNTGGQYIRIDEKDFVTFGATENLSGTFTVTAVREHEIDIDTSDVSWQVFTNKQLIKTSYDCSAASTFTTADGEINSYVWYEDSTAITDKITVTGSTHRSPAIGQQFDGFIGPITCRDGAQLAVLNLVANNGFYKYYKGTERDVSTQIDVVIQELDSDDKPTGNEYTKSTTFRTNSRSKTKQAAISFEVDISIYDKCQLLARRRGNRDKGENVSNIDKVNFQSLDFETDIVQPETEDMTICQFVIPASISALQSKKRQINYDWTRIITPYIGNGQYGAKTPTSTFAETVIALSLDKYNGRKLLSEIDADSLLATQSEMLAYYGTSDAIQVGYNLDSTKMRFQDIFNLFCDSVLCKAFVRNGILQAYPDIERTESSKQFTHRNKIQGTSTKEDNYEPEYDGIELSYRSNKTKKFETVIKHLDGTESFNRMQIELSCAVNEAQAEIRANRELNILQYKLSAHVFEADGIGRYCVLGERVDNVDDTRIVKRDTNMNHYAIYSGEVVSQNGLVIELSEPVYFEAGETHSIRFTSSQGVLLEAISCSKGDNDYQVVLSNAPSSEIYTGYQKKKTQFTFASDVSRLALPVTIRSLVAKERSGLKTTQINAINYDSRYYTNDKDFS